ncbi:putative ORFan [Tupanvirus deep ocean]|uniref:ORFan n=2 Tax=Tupanvirus TaxID=2094720 RepID=A0AC62A9Q3_9VIRU|nr:putative ORFan [Tupanvirus deep ocean]QKU34510.1 putative ORFan [Tupanvirus deep ocean]
MTRTNKFTDGGDIFPELSGHRKWDEFFPLMFSSKTKTNVLFCVYVRFYDNKSINSLIVEKFPTSKEELKLCLVMRFVIPLINESVILILLYLL